MRSRGRKKNEEGRIFGIRREEVRRGVEIFTLRRVLLQIVGLSVKLWEGRG